MNEINILNALKESFDLQKMESEFLKTETGMKSKMEIMNQGYSTYEVPIKEIKYGTFATTVTYKNGLFVSLNMTLMEKENQEYNDDMFTEKSLLMEKKKQDEWLEATIGFLSENYKFQWGTIESVIDWKSWGAYIVIKIHRDYL